MLPGELLDYICSLDSCDHAFKTIGLHEELFQVPQRCRRLSMISTHFYKWSKQSVHHREIEELILVGLTMSCNEPIDTSSIMPTLCKIIEHTEPFMRVFIKVIDDPFNALLRDIIFTRMRNCFRHMIHKTQIACHFFNITVLLSKVAVTGKPTTLDDVELLFAFYNAYVDFKRERTFITKPQAYTVLAELAIYNEAAAAATTEDNNEYQVSVYEKDGYTTTSKIDARFLEPVSLMGEDILINFSKAYAMTNKNALSPLEFARASRASDRLRRALRQCYEAKYTEKQRNRRKRGNLA